MSRRNIQRVIFQTVEKFSSSGLQKISPGQIKQIAGRAGRFGFGAAEGQVTCLREADMEYLQVCMKTPAVPYTRAGLQPTPSTIETITRRFPELSLVAILVGPQAPAASADRV